MSSADWAAAGFSTEEAERLDAIQHAPDEFPLSRLVSLWQEWVSELERALDWEREELESAWSTRDDLEEAMVSTPIDLRHQLYAMIDVLDLRFRDLTVALPHENAVHGRWWWGRIPVRNQSRLYVLRRI